MTPALVAVAHGSRDPRSAATVAALVDRLRLLRPDVDIRLSFLDLHEPRLDSVLTALPEPHAVVVPLLLGRAYHADADVPQLADLAQAVRPELDVAITPVLGPDPRLETTALCRLAEAGITPEDPATGVVLAAAGSVHTSANDAVASIAERWTRHTRWQVVAAFACAAQPTVPAAIARLRAAGTRRIAVSSWFLAPGVLPEKVTRLAREAAPAALITRPLGAHGEIAELVAERYDSVLPSPLAVPA